MRKISIENIYYKINQGFVNLRLCNEEIEEFADDLCQKQNRTLENPKFDVEAYIEFDLNIPLQYRKISLDDTKLGMTILVSGNVVIYDNNEVYEEFYNIGTIIIDKDACKLNSRFRFTMCHELGHYYFDVPRYNKNGDVLVKNIECNIEEYNVSKDNWEEWRANRFAACILMPRLLFVQDVTNYLRRRFSIIKNENIKTYKNGPHMMYLSSEERESTFSYFCDKYGVSRDALINRLIEFNFLEKAIYNCKHIRNNKKFEL